MRKIINCCLLLFFLLGFTNVYGNVTKVSNDSSYGVVNVSVCNLRDKGDFPAEMITQALLGMPIVLIQLKFRILR